LDLACFHRLANACTAPSHSLVIACLKRDRFIDLQLHAPCLFSSHGKCLHRALSHCLAACLNRVRFFDFKLLLNLA
jgi:hypothetical protein